MSFYERFDIQVGVKDARKRFVNRVQNNIFNVISGSLKEEFAKELAFILANKKGDRFIVEDFTSYIGFHETLQSAEIIYQYFNSNSEFEEFSSFAEFMASEIAKQIRMAEIDLGVRFEEGKFHRKGAAELDEALVNETLRWLREKDFASVLKLFEKGLGHFVESEKNSELLSDVVTDMYEAAEAIAKVVTGKQGNDLSGNRELMISKLKLSDGFSKMLKEYISYANEFRHAGEQGKPKPKLASHEVEAFVYLTGTFIRLAMQADKQNGDS